VRVPIHEPEPDASRGWMALLLPAFAPAMVLAWVVTAMADKGWSIVFLPLSFVALWAARPSVGRYASSLEVTPRVPQGFLQFTPGYFEFHARRSGLSAKPFWVLCTGLVSVVVLGWCTFIAGTFVDVLG
jgi:hypothetical protein